jgi:hypothetical protein
MAAFGSSAAPTLAASNYTTHQGIDSCHVPSNSQLHELWSGTPFYQWGFYLGGSTAEWKGCASWSSTKLQAAIGIGWGVTPIWDAKQAPSGCTTSSPYHMSINTSTAHDQGVASANSAAQAMADLGFDEFDMVWLDIEHYDTTDSDCVAAVRSYVDGWSQQLGIDAGVYANPSAIGNWWTLAHRPDSVWVADWIGPANPNTVWGLSPLPDTKWPNTNAQRMHQYRGIQDSNTDTRFSMDIDCADAWIDFGLLNSGYNPTAATCIGATQPNNPY